MCFRKTLVHCTAPALCEIKPACLFSVRTSDYLKCKEAIIESYQELRNAGKSLRIIRRSETCFLFFIYDEGQIVVLFNGFQKKSQKTPPNEIQKAIKIKEEYYADKQSSNRGL